MYVGHFGVATLLAQACPHVPSLVAYTGVGFPDLLWGALVLAGVEEVAVDPASADQTHTRFLRYPYSHSLVLTQVLALVPAGILALVLHSLAAGAVFVAGSLSHWLLDAVVHVGDLPVLGFGRDRKVGLGLWRRPGTAFAVEYAVYAVPTLLATGGTHALRLLAIGAAFHLLNANAFFHWTPRNPFPSPRVFASAVLVGFLALAWALHGAVA